MRQNKRPSTIQRYIREYLPYLIALLPVLILRDFTPASELRFLSIANEALDQGRLFCLTFQGEPYVDETPAYIWWIMLLKAGLGHHYMVTIASLSLLASIGVLMIMNRWVERFGMHQMRLSDGSQTRSLASFMLFTTGLMLPLSFFVSPAMPTLFWIVLTLYTFWRLSEKQGSYGLSPDLLDADKRRRLQWFQGIYLFAGTFFGGIQGFAIPFLSMIIFSITVVIRGRMTVREAFHTWDRASNWRTWLVFVLLLWLWALGTWAEGGGVFLRAFVRDQLLNPIFVATHHTRPWYYHLFSIWWDTLPWGPLFLILLAKKRRMKDQLDQFFVSIALTVFILCSCFREKLDVYLLPAIPFLVYAGVMQMRHYEWPLRWHWRIVWTCRSLLLLIFIGGCLCPILNPYFGAYGRICYRAKRLARVYDIERVYVYDLPRVKGMDVYLHLDPIPVSANDIAQGKVRDGLLIMSRDSRRELNLQLDELALPDSLRGEVISSFGPYRILKY